MLAFNTPIPSFNVYAILGVPSCTYHLYHIFISRGTNYLNELNYISESSYDTIQCKKFMEVVSMKTDKYGRINKAEYRYVTRSAKMPNT
jgi:hypothetical protein